MLIYYLKSNQLKEIILASETNRTCRQANNMTWHRIVPYKEIKTRGESVISQKKINDVRRFTKKLKQINDAINSKSGKLF
jgi:hypothetical protein